ncbi:hypothetical protein EYF80_039052 [Liparis tanakae]|uniref:Uncharacterized protein n=1 Tax=Liparis tanakae TaxID=230148 RepID=A0A4Z2GBX2_9TELE|nr:hypothetical protein EYF80_039052 [Liparis tanakae]
MRPRQSAGCSIIWKHIRGAAELEVVDASTVTPSSQNQAVSINTSTPPLIFTRMNLRPDKDVDSRRLLR